MERHGALENITVLDLGRVLAAPYCASILADLGARVIKVERPVIGDDSRQYGPYINKESMYFTNINRNKEGITLNMKSEEGKEVLKDLVRHADVLIENFRPGVMDKLGLGYDVLKEVNPRLVYLEISGFGGYGRYSQRPGYDLLAQAMGGMMSLTGARGGEPTRAGTSIGDLVAGINGALGVLAALNSRTLTGKGQKVDVALLDTMVVLLENYLTRYRVSGEIPPRLGNAYSSIGPYDSFHAKDGDFVLACGNQNLFEKFCRTVTHHEEWITDPRFASNLIRTENADDLKVLIEEFTKNYTVDEMVDMCLKAGIPAAPIFDLYQVTHDPHIVEDRGMFPECDHPLVGKQFVNGDAIKLSDTPAHIYRHAPLLGQDTDAIMKELLGYDEAKIAELKEKKAI